MEKYTSAGMSPEEARRRARLVFGRQEQVKECCREARGIGFLETLFQDMRYGLRIFRKNSSFSIIAVLTLALGIGASTAVFSLVNTILLKPLPYPNASRIVMLWRANSVDSIFGSESFPWQGLEFSQLKQTATAFQNLGAFKKDDFNLTGSGTPEHLEGVRASAGFFPALGMAPLLGRNFTTEEDKPGGALVVVLSHRLWKSRFGGDLDVVGRVIDLNGFPYTVIGVMPAEFTFPNGEGMPVGVDLPKYPQLWVPLALPAAPRQAPSDLGVIGELKPNIGLAQVQQDLRVFDRRWLEMFPGWKGWFSQVVPLRQQTVADTQRPLLLLLGAVCVVLLIACSNVAGLTLNRSLSRRREFTVARSPGGATRPVGPPTHDREYVVGLKWWHSGNAGRRSEPLSSKTLWTRQHPTSSRSCTGPARVCICARRHAHHRASVWVGSSLWCHAHESGRSAERRRPTVRWRRLRTEDSQCAAHLAGRLDRGAGRCLPVC